ncbi:uncharacterized protein HHUB_2576 [Halobacterium hubeiense]|uniref:Uncharacterized protein n=1 Tax=Halobacterium hubeiense TaxID=1407499 RepID=A0A0U5H3E9_9EURY|nr:hypothetical protein [Halobacterium hubeiense]CQH57655.1 uncharacterized protein HHUB_2576 [Halobacterium hubeiense]
MDASRRNLALAAVGGALWAVVPPLDGTVAWVWSVAPVAPVLVAFGVLECWRRYRADWGRVGRAGAALSWMGLALLTVAALLQQALAGLVAVFAVAPVAVSGALALWAGAAFLAVVLRRAGVVDRVGAAAFVLALPASAVLNAVLGPAALGLAPVSLPVGLGLYGVAWVALPVRLSRTSESAARAPPSTAAASSESVLESPERVVAAAVGLAVGVLTAAGVVPFGVPGGTPLTGETAVLDAIHATLGVAGVLAAVAGARYASWYDRLGGVAFLALAALPFFPGQTPFGLAFVDLVVYVPAAVVTLGVAAAAAGGDSPLQLSGVDDGVRDGGEDADGENGRADREH